MRNRFVEKLVVFIFDIIAFHFAFFVTFWIRYKSGIIPECVDELVRWQEYIVPSFIVVFSWEVVFFFTGLYRDWYKESRLDEFLVVSRTVIFGSTVLFLMISADEILHFVKTGENIRLLTHSQFVTLTSYTFSMLLFATSNRFLVHSFLAWLFSRGIAIKNILIIGAKDSGIRLYNKIKDNKKLGYRVVGFVDDDGSISGSSVEGLTVLGTYSQLPKIIASNKIEAVIISRVSASPNEIFKILQYTADTKITIYMTPSLVDVISGHLKTHEVFGLPLMVLLQDHMPGWEAQIKRLADIGLALTIMIIGAPLWILTAVAVKITSGGPVLYKQERVGRDGKKFVMLKFRSMYNNAEKYSGPKWASKNDPRITPLGRIMRKIRLDEVPQIVNVLKGDMSFVGPRPEREHFVKILQREIPWYTKRIRMTPGITGWAQVNLNYDETIEDVKQKVLYDMFYFENMSLLLDLKIIIKTVIVVFAGKGAR